MEIPLRLQAAETAALVIDMHRGHLDPSCATMPVPEPGTLVARTAGFLDALRQRGVMVVFSVLQSRMIEGLGRDALANPFRAATVAHGHPSLTLPADLAAHNTEGSVQTQVMPELGPFPGDHVVASKRRFGSFYGTDLEILLRVLGTKTVLLLGVNTNTCVTCAAFEAYNRDFSVVLVEDCTASGYGDDLHDFAVQNVRRCLGWVRDTAQVLALLDQPDAP